LYISLIQNSIQQKAIYCQEYVFELRAGESPCPPLQKGTRLSSPWLKHRGFQARDWVKILAIPGRASLNLQPINNGHEYGGNDDPKQLEPVEEWDTYELRRLEVIEGWEEHEERDE
jgi:hypothetical protein